MRHFSHLRRGRARCQSCCCCCCHGGRVPASCHQTNLPPSLLPVTPSQCQTWCLQVLLEISCVPETTTFEGLHMSRDISNLLVWNETYLHVGRHNSLVLTPQPHILTPTPLTAIQYHAYYVYICTFMFTFLFNILYLCAIQFYISHISCIWYVQYGYILYSMCIYTILNHHVYIACVHIRPIVLCFIHM